MTLLHSIQVQNLDNKDVQKLNVKLGGCLKRSYQGFNFTSFSAGEIGSLFLIVEINNNQTNRGKSHVI